MGSLSISADGIRDGNGRLPECECQVGAVDAGPQGVGGQVKQPCCICENTNQHMRLCDAHFYDDPANADWVEGDLEQPDEHIEYRVDEYERLRAAYDRVPLSVDAEVTQVAKLVLYGIRRRYRRRDREGRYGATAGGVSSWGCGRLPASPGYRSRGYIASLAASRAEQTLQLAHDSQPSTPPKPRQPHRI